MPGLTQIELDLISDVEVLAIKRDALQKVNDLLLDTKNHLEAADHLTPLAIPQAENAYSGKISRGENYRGLPYLILDFPAYFSEKDIFAFRTMFWWGHFFSVALHLQGTYLQQHIQAISNNFDQLIGNSIFISIADTPWEYHYAADNYILLEENHREPLGRLDFLKLSIQIPLHRSQDLPTRASEFYQLIGKVIGDG